MAIEITQEEFDKKFGTQTTTEPVKTGYLQNLKETVTQLPEKIGQRADTAYQAYNQGNIPRAFGQGAGAVSDVLGTALSPVTEIPIIKENPYLSSAAMGAASGATRAGIPGAVVGAGIGVAYPAIQEGISKLTQTEEYQKLAQQHPKIAGSLEAVGNLINATLQAEALRGVKDTAVEVPEITKQTLGGIKKIGDSIPPGGVGSAIRKVAEVTKNSPENIMTRVARLNPNDEVAFKKVSGKTPGEYLVETGNFESPEKIIANEAKKFTESKASVDAELSKLPGEYKLGALRDGLVELLRKGKKVATQNVPAEFANRAQELLVKHEQQGLSMSEINEAKRLIERELKLGYNKTLNPDAVQKATNIDAAIRKWQIEKADYLGFKNIRELNKQTQISKFLVDKLGNKIVGQEALNNVGLTDWVVLAGGDPTAVGAFLTKKFFSSKTVQARIAKMLNTKPIQGTIKAKGFQPAGLLEAPKTYNLPGNGILEGQSKLRE